MDAGCRQSQLEVMLGKKRVSCFLFHHLPLGPRQVYVPAVIWRFLRDRTFQFSPDVSRLPPSPFGSCESSSRPCWKTQVGAWTPRSLPTCSPRTCSPSEQRHEPLPGWPLPNRPGGPCSSPSPSPLPRRGQWPRRLDTPSPWPASRFLCQTKRDSGGARAGAAEEHPPREAWPAGEGHWPSGPGPGSLDAAADSALGAWGLWEQTGLPSPAPGWWGRTRQEQPPPRGHGTWTCPVTLTGTQSWITHTEIQRCRRAHAGTHTQSTSADIHTQLTKDTYTAHTGLHIDAHTITCSHITCITSPRPRTGCLHTLRCT